MRRVTLLIILLSLFVSPVFCGEAAGDKIFWQGHEFEISSFITDRELLSGYEWPEEGRLLQIKLFTTDDAAIPETMFVIYAHEFVVLDGAGGVYRPFEALPETDDGTRVTLTYHIDAPVASDGYKLDIWRRGALWADAHYRGAGSPFKGFVSEDPHAFVCAVALEDNSMYRYDKNAAITNPDDAFKELGGDLKEIIGGLKKIFNDSGITVSDDPNAASVVIGVNVQYPLAGKYGAGGAIKAYNCVLTLTAYDAVTHKKITGFTVGSYFGNTISVQAGVTTTWKYVPSVAAADAADRSAFIGALRDHWN